MIKEVQREYFYDPREEQLMAEDAEEDEPHLNQYTARANEQENIFKAASYNHPTYLNEAEEYYKVNKERNPEDRALLSRENSPHRIEQKKTDVRFVPFAIRKTSHPNQQLISFPPINMGKQEFSKGNC